MMQQKSRPRPLGGVPRTAGQRIDAGRVVSRLPEYCIPGRALCQISEKRPWAILGGMIGLAWRRGDWAILEALDGLGKRWGGNR